MLKWQIEAGKKASQLELYFGVLLLFLAEIAIFHWIATPWPFILGLLYISQTQAYSNRLTALRALEVIRVQLADNTMTRIALSMFHHDEHVEYETEGELWLEVSRRARVELDDAEQQSSMAAEILGQKPGNVWGSLVFSVLFEMLVIGLAWFLSRLW